MNKETNKLIPELRFPEFAKDGEWKEKRLGEVGEFVGGGTPDTSISEYWNGEIQWFTPTEIKNGVVRKSLRTITDKGLQNSSAKLLPSGTILITTRATIGDVGITKEPCTTNQGFQSLIVKKGQHNIFWYYWLIQHKNKLTLKASGSTFPEIGKNEIVKIISRSPQIAEQQKIASCLSSLDEVITANSQKLDALKTHKKGLMQNLFPQMSELGLKGLKDDRIFSENEILKSSNPKNHNSDNVPKWRFPEFVKDGKWVEKKLGEVAELTSSKRVHLSDYVSNGIPFFRGKEISQLKNNNIPSDLLYISEEQYTAIKEKYGVPGIGNILITAVGTLGNVYCVKNNDRFYFKDGNLIWMKNISINSSFLEVLLDAEKEKILASAIGSSQKALTMAALNKLDFKIPKNPKEQQKVADCLSSLDALITAQTEKIEQLKLHKKGLMQGLFPKTIQ